MHDNIKTLIRSKSDPLSILLMILGIIIAQQTWCYLYHEWSQCASNVSRYLSMQVHRPMTIRTRFEAILVDGRFIDVILVDGRFIEVILNMATRIYPLITATLLSSFPSTCFQKNSLDRFGYRQTARHGRAYHSNSPEFINRDKVSSRHSLERRRQRRLKATSQGRRGNTRNSQSSKHGGIMWCTCNGLNDECGALLEAKKGSLVSIECDSVP